MAEELGNHVECGHLCCFGPEGVSKHVRSNRCLYLSAEPSEQIVQRMELHWFAERRPIKVDADKVRAKSLPTRVAVGSVPLVEIYESGGRRGLRAVCRSSLLAPLLFWRGVTVQMRTFFLTAERAADAGRR